MAGVVVEVEVHHQEALLPVAPEVVVPLAVPVLQADEARTSLLHHLNPSFIQTSCFTQAPSFT